MLVSPALTKGSVELLILSLLEDGELYGYQITKRIEGRSNKLLKFRRSSIYPVLSRMEERGWIQGRWGSGNRPRCYYSLTEAGTEALERQRVEWRVFTAAVNLILEDPSEGEDPPSPGARGVPAAGNRSGGNGSGGNGSGGSGSGGNGHGGNGSGRE